MRYWLMKSEPAECSIDDLEKMPERRVPWFGVRNYQARNFMTRDMAVGDGVLFYHSSCPHPGIAGLARVASAAHPDETQFDPQSPYFDSKASRQKPRWYNVDVAFVAKTPLVGLAALRARSELAGMRVLARGNRLSITPVTDDEWRFILSELLDTDPDDFQ